MKNNRFIFLFLASFLLCSFAYSFQTPGSANPPEPPGDGGDGALVKDVPEMALDYSLLFILLGISLAYFYFKKTDFFFFKHNKS
ncbi:hypothetical protein [Psychroflexus salis]|uniref:hypothetical protein n=1 Tax=Psychroflexus salis TaxID=1526574 RepID=UPI00166763BB|nr:hypothetical protein [Psychroflexus salis]